MKVIREKTIVQKIDEEIEKKGLPNIVRIDLDNEEFTKFMVEISEGVITTTSEGQLIKLKSLYSSLVSKSNVRYKVRMSSPISYLGSYIKYRDVCVQCCYEGDF